jgi:hypothetical protein
MGLGFGLIGEVRAVVVERAGLARRVRGQAPEDGERCQDGEDDDAPDRVRLQ